MSSARPLEGISGRGWGAIRLPLMTRNGHFAAACQFPCQIACLALHFLLQVQDRSFFKCHYPDISENCEF